MSRAPQYHNYDRFPRQAVDCNAGEVFSSWETIRKELLAQASGRAKTVLTLECYPGTSLDEIRDVFSDIPCFHAEACAMDSAELTRFFQPNLTDDRVFGRMTTGKLADCFLPERLEQMRRDIDAVPSGVLLVYGTGASLVTTGDVLVYCDVSRWEIQLRYRRGMPNWHCDNGADPQLSKYKRGYFIEWRLADRQKETLLPRLDYYIDTNRPNQPAMIAGSLLQRAFSRLAASPFRTVPYFDPGPWGGQWMKEVCGLDLDSPNYAWSFDGVPEENSILLDCAGQTVEIPAMNLVLARPRELLGEKVYGRYGAEFPIRFDFLDTMGGGNLSLQVHPLTSYIQQAFGMHYTQDESYYILDCEEDACVYLGLKTGVSSETMIPALKQAQQTGAPFDAEEFVNRIPAKKHDHFLIPAGTVHCSGANAMVLEISATPYIFTFKLYDWGRLGLDGLPRPIHIEHGEQVIQWDRDTEWVYRNLVHQERPLYETEHCRAEQTGLHPLEPITTTRYWFDEPILLSTNGGVNMLNLVEGGEARIESPGNHFAPFTVHYAETFILPASVEEYRICPCGVSHGKQIGVIRAEIRA